MSAQLEPMSRIASRGTAALVRELGVVDAIRFLNHFRTGEGDYTKERRTMFEGASVDDLAREFKEVPKSHI